MVPEEVYTCHEALHDGRLAGAVFTDQRVNFSITHPEIDAPECLNAWETLGNVDHLEQVFV
jgi:hypothetical protein